MYWKREIFMTKNDESEININFNFITKYWNIISLVIILLLSVGLVYVYNLKQVNNISYEDEVISVADYYMSIDTIGIGIGGMTINSNMTVAELQNLYWVYKENYPVIRGLIVSMYDQVCSAKR
jgi:hypothetical protein